VFHGASQNSAWCHFSQWDWSWENDFAELFSFLSYDRRGCYRSSSPASGYELENQAHDLPSFLTRSLFL
jgi:hypothetical protein